MITRAAFFRVARYLLPATLIIYLLSLCFPQPLFAYRAAFRNLVVYSHQPPDANLNLIMEHVGAKLDASGINDLSDSHDIYLCCGSGEFTYFANRHYDVFGLNHPVVNNIFINKSDPIRNAVFSPVYQRHSRTLEGVITHEVVHVLMRRRYGLLAEQQMPLWKREGYPDYVSRETYLDYEEGVRMVKESKLDDLSGLDSQPYFKYYLMVKYLIEVEGLNIDQIVGGDFDQNDLERKVARDVKSR